MSWISDIYGTEGEGFRVGDIVKDPRHGIVGKVVRLANGDPTQPCVEYEISREKLRQMTGYYVDCQNRVAYWTAQTPLIKIHDNEQ